MLSTQCNYYIVGGGPDIIIWWYLSLSLSHSYTMKWVWGSLGLCCNVRMVSVSPSTQHEERKEQKLSDDVRLRDHGKRLVLSVTFQLEFECRTKERSWVSAEEPQEDGQIYKSCCWKTAYFSRNSLLQAFLQVQSVMWLLPSVGLWLLFFP